MIAKPSPAGFADLVPKPKPLVVPPRAFNNAKFIILYRDWDGNKITQHNSSKAMLIAYERLINKGFECEVWNDRPRRVKLKLRKDPGRYQPKYSFA